MSGGCRRTGRALRNSQFAIRNGQGFFSGFHFRMDDWGERTRPACSFQRPRWKHGGCVRRGRRTRQPGRLCSPFLTWRRLGRACKRGRNLDGGLLPNAAAPMADVAADVSPLIIPAGRSLSRLTSAATALRNPQFAIRNCQGFFSGFHFGLDDCRNEFGFDARPHLLSSPPGEDYAANGFWLAESCPANPVARIFKGTADDSPSYPSPIGWERVVEDRVRE
jgi:hypothetical protein